jgi:hypothetical protein
MHGADHHRAHGRHLHGEEELAPLRLHGPALALAQALEDHIA